MSPSDRKDQVEGVLDQLRPAMEADGGGVEVVAIEGACVRVRLRGTCLGCPSASLTMRLGIERRLREKLPWVERVCRDLP